MKKYKQTIIPKVNESLFKEMTLKEIKPFVKKYYNEKFKGKTFINKHKGISVKFSRKGIDHVIYGRTRGNEKLKAVVVLDKMIQNAVYSNFGEPDKTDPPGVLGFLNFKVKVNVENKEHFFRVVVRITKDGKFFYDHAVKIVKSPV